MTVEATSYYDSLLLSSSASSEVSYTTDEESTTLTSNDFLTLLVTELEYQDPTEPMDNVEMVNQLTQYSQLDELTSMNEKMDDLTESLSTMYSSTGLEYIGKEVEAEGYTVNKDGDDVSTIYFTLEENAADLYANIYDSNGTIVASVSFGEIEAGSHAYQWDGDDYDGDEADDGNYYVLFSAEDADGDEIDVSTTTTGTVTGVSTTDDGVYLVLSDGRTVSMDAVSYATN